LTDPEVRTQSSSRTETVTRLTDPAVSTQTSSGIQNVTRLTDPEVGAQSSRIQNVTRLTDIGCTNHNDNLIISQSGSVLNNINTENQPQETEIAQAVNENPIYPMLPTSSLPNDLQLNVFPISVDMIPVSTSSNMLNFVSNVRPKETYEEGKARRKYRNKYRYLDNYKNCKNVSEQNGIDNSTSNVSYGEINYNGDDITNSSKYNAINEIMSNLSNGLCSGMDRYTRRGAYRQNNINEDTSNISHSQNGINEDAIVLRVLGINNDANVIHGLNSINGDISNVSHGQNGINGDTNVSGGQPQITRAMIHGLEPVIVLDKYKMINPYNDNQKEKTYVLMLHNF